MVTDCYPSHCMVTDCCPVVIDSALGAAALDGKLYVCGGYDGVSSLSSVECYDPVADR